MELRSDFLTAFFVGLRGYTRPADGGQPYTLSREKRVQVDSQHAAAVLGDLNGHERFLLAVEGQDTLRDVGLNQPSWFWYRTFAWSRIPRRPPHSPRPGTKAWDHLNAFAD